MTDIFLVLPQALQVLFLWTHDWIPLGRLNEVGAVRSEDTTWRLERVTLIQSAPFTNGLFYFFVRSQNGQPGTGSCSAGPILSCRMDLFPSTAHIPLHLATVATLLVLLVSQPAA